MTIIVSIAGSLGTLNSHMCICIQSLQYHKYMLQCVQTCDCNR